MRMLLIIGVVSLLIACHSQPRQEQPSANAAGQQPTTQPAPSGAKQYELRGTVVAVYKDKRELRVKHEDIPGYMHGMTMNFPVRDDAAFASLAPGDEITADLVVAAPGDYWLANIRKSPPAKPAS